MTRSRKTSKATVLARILGATADVLANANNRARPVLAPPYRAVRNLLFRGVFERGGFETSSEMWIERLHQSPDRGRYVASGWFYLRRALPRSEVAPHDVFVDIGSGKGRVLYQAARHYPFARVIGVEIAGELNEIAGRNLALKQDKLRCKNVELVTADAATWRVPDDVTVVYLLSPVFGDTFRTVLANIIASIDRNPRRLRLIYGAPLMEKEIVRTGRFRRIKRVQSVRPHLLHTLVVYEHPVP